MSTEFHGHWLHYTPSQPLALGHDLRTSVYTLPLLHTWGLFLHSSHTQNILWIKVCFTSNYKTHSSQCLFDRFLLTIYILLQKILLRHGSTSGRYLWKVYGTGVENCSIKTYFKIFSMHFKLFLASHHMHYWLLEGTGFSSC